MDTTSTASEEPPRENLAFEARRITLIRIEHAAGAAFGCDNDTGAAPSGRFLRVPATLALVTLATAVAATITYFS